MSYSLQPHGLQHTRFPCPSLSPRVCSNSCSLSQWYYLTISSSATLFTSCPQSSPGSGSFPMSQLSTSDGHSIRASAAVLPMNIQWWCPCSPKDSQESSPALQFESINSLVLSLLYGPALTSVHDYWKTHNFWLYGPLLAKWCLCPLIIHCLCLS